MSACAGADGPLEPVRVCDIMANSAAYDGKVVAVAGRFSFRENGRMVGEEACDQKLTAGEFPWPSVLRIAIDTKNGPKAPPVFEFDAKTLDAKLQAVKQRTALATFRFGSIEYDGWAVVYGRIEFRHDLKTPPVAAVTKRNLLQFAPAQIVCRGESMILFVREDADR